MNYWGMSYFIYLLDGYTGKGRKCKSSVTTSVIECSHHGLLLPKQGVLKKLASVWNAISSILKCACHMFSFYLQEADAQNFLYRMP